MPYIYKTNTIAIQHEDPITLTRIQCEEAETKLTESKLNTDTTRNNYGYRASTIHAIRTITNDTTITKPIHDQDNANTTRIHESFNTNAIRRQYQ